MKKYMGLFAIIIFIMGLIPTWLGKYIEFFAASYAWFALWGYIVAWILTLFSSKGKWKTASILTLTLSGLIVIITVFFLIATWNKP
ncbi:hypothetical protein [Fictibacillus sp. JL2B1089]|uniref:hypothetical protein n=1 Tax=Fictibacillus sp. JL2B1089 TaxID=3399565 RepID=UPI003A89229F